MAESASQRDFFGQSTASRDETPEDLFHDQHLALQERMRNPIAFHAEMLGDIMYYHQALQQPDAKQFADAVVKEVNGHVDNNHWNLNKREDVPEDVQVVPSVWSLRRKRNLTTNEITKYKARLNLHGGEHIFGMNYFETYAPVVTWLWASSSTGLFVKLTSLWLIPKLPLRRTSTWNFLKALRLRLATPRTTCSSS